MKPKTLFFFLILLVTGLTIFGTNSLQASQTNEIDITKLVEASKNLIQTQFGTEVDLEFQVVNVEQDNSIAHVELQLTQNDEEYGSTTEVVHIYAIYVDRSLDVIFREPGPDFFTYANQIPERFLPRERLNQWVAIQSEELNRLVTTNSGDYRLPFNGGTQHTISRGGTSHENKYDFQMTSETLLRAARGGNIVAVYDDSPGNCRPSCTPSTSAGNYVRMVHSDGTYGVYFHLLQGGEILVNAGQTISQGTCLGYSGNTGNSSGPHLHFASGVDAWANTANLVAWTEAPSNNPYLSGSNFMSPLSQNLTGACGVQVTGYIDAPIPDPSQWRQVVVRIEGWAKAEGDNINRVEIWIDGVQRANAVYGTPRPDVGGNYGYYWDWDTTQFSDGNHTIQVKGVANNNTSNWLIVSNTSNDAILPIKTDNNPPLNPNSSNSGCGVGNNVWQNTCNDPNFTWSGASDGNGIGLKDYQYYWGTSSTGSLTTYTTSAGFDPTAVSGSVATYYLRIAARDQLNQQNPNPSTLFILRYDSAAPTASIQINNGSATTNQVNVTINPTASDVGSGVEQVRVSSNGVEWSAWQTYQAGMSIPWVLPALNRQEHTVYAQVKDRAGNLSTTASDTIMLELYPLAPHSANYRLCANVVNVAGQSGLGSTTYRLTSNIGETWIGAAASAGYQGKGGLLADLENCRPIEYVAGEEFILTNSVIASGGSLRGNANYLLGDTVGETAASAPNAFNSNNYQLTSGFWSDVQVGSGAPPPPPPTPIPVTVTPTPAPGPTSTPVPTTFSVSIGNGVQFTNNANVTVRVTAPNVNQVRLSNDGGYADDNWQPYQTNLNWTIDTYGSYVLPRFVYAWFKDADGIVYGTYFDDIIYDPVAPTGSISLLGGDGDLAALYLPATDDNSGVAEMRVSSDETFSDADWVAYEQVIGWDEPQSAVYAQFRDAAGNVSEVYSTEGEIGLGSAIYLPIIIQ